MRTDHIVMRHSRLSSLDEGRSADNRLGRADPRKTNHGETVDPQPAETEGQGPQVDGVEARVEVAGMVCESEADVGLAGVAQTDDEVRRKSAPRPLESAWAYQAGPSVGVQLRGRHDGIDAETVKGPPFRLSHVQDPGPAAGGRPDL